MTDRRLERLRQIDAAAQKAPWMGGFPTEDDWRLITTARNILPATIELLEEVLSESPVSGLPYYPLNLRQAALAVLDQIEDDDA